MLEQGHHVVAAQGTYVVLIDELPTVTKGGLHLPQTHLRKLRDENGPQVNSIAKIVAVGLGFNDKNGVRVEPSFNKGDYVMVNPQAMFPLQHGSGRLWVTSISSVLGGVLSDDQFERLPEDEKHHVYTIEDI